MENKINVYELLKACPKGMELDSPVWNNIVFEEIDCDNIVIFRKSIGAKVYLTQYGAVNSIDGNCVIFPKGKTTWEGFHRPFKDGDIVATENGIFIGIVKVKNNVSYETYCAINDVGSLSINTPYYFSRFATEEEKEKLFKVIKDNGYQWNPETKTLDELFPYKIGTKVWTKSDKEHKYIHTIVGISSNSFGNLEYEIKEEKTGTVVHYPKDLLIPVTEEKPKFKDGDIVTCKNGNALIACIYKERKNTASFYHYIALYKGGLGIVVNGEIVLTSDELCLATEEEKEKLFKAIKDNGYKWNEESKSLEKLSKFKAGDRIILKNNRYNIPSIRINAVIDGQYILENGGFLYIDSTDEKYVLENKFDINTLIPFESRVLVRDNDYDEWKGAFWSHLRQKADIKYDTIRGVYRQCIPYNDDTKHLLGKTNSCDEYYKTWE